MKHLFVILILLTSFVLTYPIAAQPTESEGKLNDLLMQLKQAKHFDEARRIEQKIWDFWNKDSKNARARELMFLGIISMEQNELDSAVLMFDGVIENDPDWAEGWNKRATVHFFIRNYEASIKDIKETLTREPRHFGALNGLGHIFTILGDDENAIRTFRHALSYHPYMKDARTVLQTLESRKKEKEKKNN